MHYTFTFEHSHFALQAVELQQCETCVRQSVSICTFSSQNRIQLSTPPGKRSRCAVFIYDVQCLLLNFTKFWLEWYFKPIMFLKHFLLRKLVVLWLQNKNDLSSGWTPRHKHFLLLSQLFSWCQRHIKINTNHMASRQITSTLASMRAKQSNSLSPAQKYHRHMKISKFWKKHVWSSLLAYSSILDQRKYCFSYTLLSTCLLLTNSSAT